MRRSLPARYLRSMLVVAVMAASLAGCYLPLRFDAEVVISRTGYYAFNFEGDVAWVPLVRAIDDRRLSGAEKREKIQRIETDLERDPATRSVRHIRDGVFNLTWQRSGDLTRARTVNFVRRSDRILGIKYVKKTGLVTLEGRAVSRRNALRLRRLRLDTTGTLKVRTDARVVEHNATRVVPIGPRNRIYVWTVQSVFDPAPKLVIALR